MKINLPTKITLARMALIPLVVIFYYLRFVHPAFILVMTLTFILAACTDFIDGHIARSRNMVTTLGKFLDPIADKALVVTGLFIIVDSNTMLLTGSPYVAWIAMVGSVIIMVRELSISAFRQIAATKGIVMAADKLGKAKTVCTLIALPALMLGLYANQEMISNEYICLIGLILLYFGIVMFIVSIILTVVSGFNYVLNNKKVFSDVPQDEIVCDTTKDETDSTKEHSNQKE